MIRKIKTYLQKRKKDKQVKEELQKKKRYFEMLRCGAIMMQFIYDDIKKMESQQFNRAQRRRFEKQLEKTGKFTSEIIDHYAKKIDQVLDYIDNQLKAKKKKQIVTGYQPNPQPNAGGTGVTKGK